MATYLMYLIVLPIVAIILSAILGKVKTAREIVSVLFSFLLLGILFRLYGVKGSYILGNLYGHNLLLQMDYLRWYFLIIGYGGGVLTMLFSWEFFKGEKDYAKETCFYFD